MTSANLSFSDKVKNHKKYITRTLWTALVALPFVSAYYILGVVMLVSRSINYARVYGQAEDILAIEKYKAVSRVMGINGIGFLLVMAVALMFAFQGFSYVFNQSQLDFYLSQPTTRLQRIKKNYANAISTFILMFVSVELVALIIAAGMGAVNAAVLMSAGIEFVRSVILFLAVYNVTVLAILLSGTYVSAFFLTGMFAFAPLIIAAEIRVLKEIFFTTYSSREKIIVYLSPVFDRFANLTSMDGFMQRSTYYSRGDFWEGLKQAAAGGIRYDIDVLIVALIAFVAVLICSRYRLAEMAGTSIVFRPIRWFVKVIVSAIIGLGTGYLVYVMYESVWTGKLYALMCILMVIATILTGCLVEVILDANIRRFFKGLPQTIIAVALVLFIFVVFKGDLLGFDTYLPNPDRVESCAIIDHSYNFYSWVNGSNYFEDIPEKYMELSDVESVIELSSIGMENSRKLKKNEKNIRYGQDTGYNVTVLYRMKSGRTIYRNILLPFDTDEALMDAIISGDEYKKGRYEVFHDEIIRDEDLLAAKNRSVRYITVNDSLETSALPYSELSSALRDDILSGNSFSYMKENFPIGEIEYSIGGRYYTNASIPVYANYDNTLALLKKYDIYSDSTLDISDVYAVDVTNYLPGYDLENESYENIPEDIESVTAIYESEEEISKIMEGAVSTRYSSSWYDYSRNNPQYHIEVKAHSKTNDYYDSYGKYYVFRTGEVPEFVIKDTNN